MAVESTPRRRAESAVDGGAPPNPRMLPSLDFPDRAFLAATGGAAVAACRSRADRGTARAAAVALDGAGPDGAARLRRHVPRARRGRDRRRRRRPPVSQRHARPGARGRAAAPGRARRLHGLGHGDLGQRRAEAAGVRLPVPVARLGSTCTASSTDRSAARPRRLPRGAPSACGRSRGATRSASARSSRARATSRNRRSSPA